MSEYQDPARYIPFILLPYLPIPFGGAKELGIVYINIIRGAKEPRNLQNHRGDIVELPGLGSALKYVYQGFFSKDPVKRIWGSMWILGSLGKDSDGVVILRHFVHTRVQRFRGWVLGLFNFGSSLQ